MSSEQTIAQLKGCWTLYTAMFLLINSSESDIEVELDKIPVKYLDKVELLIPQSCLVPCITSLVTLVEGHSQIQSKQHEILVAEAKI